MNAVERLVMLDRIQRERRAAESWGVIAEIRLRAYLRCEPKHALKSAIRRQHAACTARNHRVRADAMAAFLGFRKAA